MFTLADTVYIRIYTTDDNIPFYIFKIFLTQVQIWTR